MKDKNWSKVWFWAVTLIVFSSMIVIVVGLILNMRREGKATQLRHERDAVCQAQKWDLETIVRTHAPQDLHARMVYRHLDQGLTQLCFGKPVVVDSASADGCWISTGHDDCYLELAGQLLEQYRNH